MIPNTNKMTLDKIHMINSDSFPDMKNLQAYLPVYQVLPVIVPTNQIVNETHIIDKHGIISERDIFIKYSPLLDPSSYLLGKYDDFGYDAIRALPCESNDQIPFKKLYNIHNSSYVDSLFSCISSQLRYTHGFAHATEYYGSFLGIKKNFRLNIADDLEHLQSFPIFSERAGKTFSAENMECLLSTNPKLRISESNADYLNDIISLDKEEPDVGGSESELKESESEIKEISLTETHISTDDIIHIQRNHKYKNETNYCESVTSNSSINYTDDEDEDEEDNDDKNTNREDENVNTNREDESDQDIDQEEEEEDNWEDEDDEDDEEENDDIPIYIHIYDFPTQMICLEKCEDTLDSLLLYDTLNEQECASCLFQIIMTLIMYQKHFKFTHNDLHTNNIVYKSTDATHFVYYYDGNTYKVPTHGRIYKIIDFGRSIYTISNADTKNPLFMCSDSFAELGDGHSQYNFIAPYGENNYYDNRKPIVEPNYSFDLCRLGCSMYDFFMDIDDLSSLKKKTPLQNLIHQWCLDDCGKHLLYMKSGKDRYPHFKLYKMIARTAHNHLPQSQLNHPLFQSFLIKTKKNKKEKEIKPSKKETFICMHI